MIMFIWWMMEKIDTAYHNGWVAPWLGKRVCDALDNYYTSE
jgi:hypothetical protein